MDPRFSLSPLSRFISTTNLNENIVDKLTKNNIKLTNHLRMLSDEDLAKQFGLNQNEIQEINEKIKNPQTKFKPISGLELDIDVQCIKSGSKQFDQAFSKNGLLTKKLTQIFGEASAGKSQICFQTCFQVQLDDLDGEALYFDTENCFRPERILDIAKNHKQKFKEKEVLGRVHVRTINTHADDLFNLIVNGKLESFLDQHPKIRLFVLDSVAYHFQYDYQYDEFFQTRQLVKIAIKLKQIAIERNIAILITNQLNLANKPALGDLWNSIFSTSLHLIRIKDSNSAFIRHCSVIKSPNVPGNHHFKYLINNETGIEDYDSCE